MTKKGKRQNHQTGGNQFFSGIPIPQQGSRQSLSTTKNQVIEKANSIKAPDPSGSGVPDEEAAIIPPFSWLFRRPGTAFGGVLLLVFGFWLVLFFLRQLFWDNESIYMSQELFLVASFIYAGAFSLILSKKFHELQKHLMGKHPELDVILLEQDRRFHHAGWLVILPVVLSALAISLRFITADYLIPFRVPWFERIFLIWLYFGFCLLLNAAVLCGRYSEIIRQLGESVIKGHLHRRELNLISSFYFRIALYSSVLFVFASLTVFSLHIIYTYSGNVWPGYAVIRKFPSLLFGNQQKETLENLSMIYEVIVIGILYLFASGAALIYFVAPQWSVHRLLSDRKRSLLAKIDEDLEKAEKEMFASPCEKSYDAFCRQSQYSEEIGRLPEWPFSNGGWGGTILLVLLPGILILLKEVFLEAFIKILTK